MNIRNITSFALILSVILLPYWIYLPAVFLAIIIFPLYWEAILIAFFVEVLYGRGVSFASPVALIAVLAIILLIPIRERLRFNV